MYLYATKYVSGYEFDKPDKISEFNKLLDSVGFTQDDICRNTPSGEIKVCVAYWRKANEIHKWFVDNVQKGKDDCGNYYVERKQLQWLVEMCKDVLSNKENAADILPTRSGFFFGSTDYDEYYFKDLENTVEMLENVINNPKLQRWAFEYHSSW